jgi:predicted lipoprotein with Yx(FWY)xxD motif
LSEEGIEVRTTFNGGRRSGGPWAAALAGGLAVSLAVAASAAASRDGASASALVKSRSTSLGIVLADAQGRTLYLFTRDKQGQSACPGQCAVYWPPYVTTGKPRTAGAAKAPLIGTTRRADGRLQVTYNGHPLYRFKQDSKAGQTMGEKVEAFGGKWYVVSPKGSKIEKPEDSGSSGGGTHGGGYSGGGYGGG